MTGYDEGQGVFPTEVRVFPHTGHEICFASTSAGQRFLAIQRLIETALTAQGGRHWYPGSKANKGLEALMGKTDRKQTIKKAVHRPASGRQARAKTPDGSGRQAPVKAKKLVAKVSRRSRARPARSCCRTATVPPRASPS